MLIGRTAACLAVPESLLAMCGATMPTNPMGPQKAVTAPVISDAENRAAVLVCLGLAPESRANSSPNSMMSRPLAFAAAIAVPARRATAIIVTPPMSVPVKLPADQL